MNSFKRKDSGRKYVSLLILLLMICLSPIEVLASEQVKLMISDVDFSRFDTGLVNEVMRSNIDNSYEKQANILKSSLKANRISVSTFAELKNAVKFGYEEINIINDIVMEEPIELPRVIKIFGNINIIDYNEVLNGDAKLPKLIGGTENDVMFKFVDEKSEWSAVWFKGIEFQGNRNSIFEIENGIDLMIETCVLRNNYADRGSVVFAKEKTGNDARLTIRIERSLVENNRAEQLGGVFYVEGFNSEIEFVTRESKFENNSSNGDGGVYYFEKSRANNDENLSDDNVFYFLRSEYTGNSSSGNGGVICINIKTDDIDNISRSIFSHIDGSKFINNHAVGSGGVYYSYKSSDSDLNEKDIMGIFVVFSTFIENFVGEDGGAIYIESVKSRSDLGMDSNNHFENNTALNGKGGAIYMNPNNSDYFERYTYIGSLANKFINNKAQIGGAMAIENFIGRIDMMESKFENNIAENDNGYAYGGAIALEGKLSEYIFENSIFIENKAEGHVDSESGFGGAIDFNLETYENPDLSGDEIKRFEGNEFSDNYANRNGGAISVYKKVEGDYVDDNNIEAFKHIKFENSRFQDNLAGRGRFQLDLLEYPNLSEMHEILVEADNVFSSEYLYDNYDVSFVNRYLIIYNENINDPEISEIIEKAYSNGDIAQVIGGDSIVREGYKFLGWNTNADGSGETFKPGDEIMMDKNIILYAQWKKVDDVEEKTEEPTDYSSIIWDRGHTTPTIDGTKLHRAYINGYPDGSIQPKGEITRGEVAAIISRLHADLEEIEYSTETKYADVKATDWYAKHVAYVSDKGLMEGYEDGSFKPEEKITRAEYATVVARFKNLDLAETSFEDASDHWANEFIGAVAKENWITGYPDGSFKPMNNISREEVATMTNKMLDRNVDEVRVGNLNIKKFTDLLHGTWSYYEMVEASNTREYVRRGTNSIVEDWKNVK